MEYYTFTLPAHVSSMFQGKIWNRGKELYEEESVEEAYAFDEKTVICKVKGTILYTVIIHFDEGEVNLECNCDYMDDCKHEVAALMYLKDHPQLPVKKKPYSLDVSELEEFVLRVSEAENDVEEEFEDYDETVDALYDEFEEVESVELRLQMLLCLNKTFSLNGRGTKIVKDLLDEDLDMVYQLLHHNEASEDFLFSLIISLAEIENQDCRQSICSLIDYLLNEPLKRKEEAKKLYDRYNFKIN